jgi:hypothetical protein
MPALNFVMPLLTLGQFNWARAFRAPIRTRDGRTLHTLSDVRLYLASLPIRVSNLPPWQSVTKLLVHTVHTECDVQALHDEITSALLLTGEGGYTKLSSSADRASKAAASGEGVDDDRCLRTPGPSSLNPRT